MRGIFDFATPKTSGTESSSFLWGGGYFLVHPVVKAVKGKSNAETERE